jgi:hypothetical protein
MSSSTERAECSVESARALAKTPHPTVADTEILEQRIVVGPADSAVAGEGSAPTRIDPVGACDHACCARNPACQSITTLPSSRPSFTGTREPG